MQVFAVQFDIAWQDKPANFARLGGLVADARPPKGSLLVLPEMFATGFSMDVDAVAEESGGETEDFLATLAKKHGVFVVGGMVSRVEGGKGSNDALICDPSGDRIARYRKMHPFSYGGEGEFYAAGEDPVSFDWNGVKVCPLVCYDLRFPEVFRTAVTRGAEVFLVVANWPRARQGHWEALLRARAIENQAYVVGVNRVGVDPKVKYRGGSVIHDPLGDTLAEAGDGERIVSAEVHPESLRDYRRRFPALQDIHRDFVRR